MVSISLCMIVKNEEDNLDRCLRSVYDLVDEIVIVDTGSTDKTKDIAKKYTSRVYDFEWIDDFSAARNFAFSKASMEYIYSADADEELLPPDREKFKILKENLMPEIEIVQMLYVEDGIRTVLNTNEELRPKLYKRLRSFVFTDPIHETVRLNPVVFDSDIRIMHRPGELHSKRDFSVFTKAYERDGFISENMVSMMCRELYKWGDKEELKEGAKVLLDMDLKGAVPNNLLQEVYTVLSKESRLNGDDVSFFKYAVKALTAAEPNSEICIELSFFYEDKEDFKEASVWYMNALFETLPVMDIGVKSEDNRKKLISALNSTGDLLLEKGKGDLSEYYYSLSEKIKTMDIRGI